MINIIPGCPPAAVILDMKPTVPETGSVLRLEGDNAVVLLRGGQSCKGCGAGKIGLCRAAGNSMMLTAKNTVDARPGDNVRVGIDPSVRISGYLLAYIAPLTSLLAAALLGYITGEYIGVASMDVIAGFAGFGVVTAFSFRRLRRLDRTHRLILRNVVTDNVFRDEIKSDEERRFESFAPDADMQREFRCG